MTDLVQRLRYEASDPEEHTLIDRLCIEDHEAAEPLQKLLVEAADRIERLEATLRLIAHQDWFLCRADAVEMRDIARRALKDPKDT